MIYTEELIARCSCIKVAESYNGPDGYGKTNTFLKEYTPETDDIVVNPNALNKKYWAKDGEMFTLFKGWFVGAKTYAQIAKFLNNIKNYYDDPIIKLYF